jgi:HK97 family phage major capsid protein
MNKKMRELMAQITAQKDAFKGYMSEGEGRDLAKAEEALNKIDELQKEYDLEARAVEMAKSDVPAEKVEKSEKVDGFKMIAKLMHRKPLDDKEKTALISGANSENGETYLVPEDVKAEINELRKTYVSAKDIVNVETTDALAGSVNYEDGAPVGLADFDDGDAIPEESGIKFVLKKFTIAWKGKLIPVSRILLGAAKASLMNYINRWFVRNAIISENTKIFATLKAGYNAGTPKALAGWKALKKSINVDLDPSCKVNGFIVTNQSGFAALDEEEDANGRPILQQNPAHPTEKLFQGLPVRVFPDTHLPNIDSTHFPVIYGDIKAGATFVEHQNLEFAISEHFLFNKNQNCLRVVEGFDVMSTDTGAYIYGSFTASAKA